MKKSFLKSLVLALTLVFSVSAFADGSSAQDQVGEQLVASSISIPVDKNDGGGEPQQSRGVWDG